MSLGRENCQKLKQIYESSDLWTVNLLNKLLAWAVIAVESVFLKPFVLHFFQQDSFKLLWSKVILLCEWEHIISNQWKELICALPW